MKKIYKDYLFEKHILAADSRKDTAADHDGAGKKGSGKEGSEKEGSGKEGSGKEGSGKEGSGKTGTGDWFPVAFALANLFRIRITEGEELLQEDMIRYVSERLGEHVPEPFYRGFPESVRELSEDRLVFDQLVHYALTYGFGDFSEAGHSLFEEQFERTAFRETTDIREFKAVTEEEAAALLGGMAADLLAGTRPLNDRQYELVRSYLADYRPEVEHIASKNTCIRLLLDTRDLMFAGFLSMSDVIRLVDELNYRNYLGVIDEIPDREISRNELVRHLERVDAVSRETAEWILKQVGDEESVRRIIPRNLRQFQSGTLKKLNLRNQDRKFIIQVMDRLFSEGRCDVRTCYEKKQLWSGLLHHLHYRAKTEEAQRFLSAMRGRENHSVLAEFERAMAGRQIRAAVEALAGGKGSAAVLRNMNYIISRCESLEDIQFVLQSIDTQNVIVLFQLLIQYAGYRPGTSPRTFRFTKYNRLMVHAETEKEVKKRQSVISTGQAAMLEKHLAGQLRELLRGRLGRVYIEPSMKNYALPLQENTSQGGFGVLTRGSRLKIPDTKKLRGFTYWEKVDDIDLSVFGLNEEGGRKEFSWRTMAGQQSEAIVYSGDETSGYYGGSEYFDIDLELFRKKYPDIRYLIFCDNVYTGIPFNQCFCKAGYMTRDLEDSGEIYEPKTVQSSFLVDCDSIFAYLFGVDLLTNDFIWLNIARDSAARVAGTTDMGFLLDYFHVTETANVYSFFEMMASELVEDPLQAEVVVTDREVECAEGAMVVREYDVEKMIALMNP